MIMRWKPAFMGNGVLAVTPDGFYKVTPKGGDWQLELYRYGQSIEQLGTWDTKNDAMKVATTHFGADH
jgi:hypothetical protein